MDRAKIVGLTIDAERLAEIRGERVRTMGAPRRRYADLEAVFEELEAASRVHRRLRCRVIDVTDLSVEETAVRAVKIVADRMRDSR
jgi:regulator of PEP synthase PpsR (kinase-PPPase family)